ncbi:MAG: GNAT family N-acetyltransferase [Deltaproteobacteria bacterium]|nr:GNAT family N-acetyltransferase [Deltaproteobacteria bacterium]
MNAIEGAAAMLLEGYAPASILNERTSLSEFREAQSAGRLWVARSGEVLVGFALVEMLTPTMPHLEEIDVAPAHGRRGVGTALVRAVCAWAAGCGYSEVTLTTFRSVPWNLPFYARLGFEEVPAEEIHPEVMAVVADEAARGLERRSRVVMKYQIADGHRRSTR